MDVLKNIIPLLWELLEKKKYCAINVSTIDNKLTINILTGRNRKKFTHKLDDSLLINELKVFLAS